MNILLFYYYQCSFIISLIFEYIFKAHYASPLTIKTFSHILVFLLNLVLSSAIL